MNTDKFIPELRFPEFVNDGEWEERKLESYIDLFSGIALKSEELSDDNSGIPILRGINITEGYIRHSKDIDKYFLGDVENLGKYLIKEHDIVIGMDGSKVGKNVAMISKGDENSILIQRVARIRTTKVADINFVYQYFISDKFIHYVDTVNTSSGIPHISSQQIKDFKVGIPLKIQEQQKIASCLSSLDEVIAAHSQKLELLKDHKKGLMQNLFPQEGEKVPKVRFKEFEKDGEWVEKKLGELTLKVGSGSTPLGGESVYKKTGRPFVRSQNVSWGVFLLENIAFIDETTHQNSLNTEIQLQDVLLNITGASIGRCAVANEFVNGGNVNQHVCIIRPEKKILNPFFLNQFLISDFGQKQIDSFQAGGNRQGLNFVQIRSLSISIPPSIQEQQKIASCLSSLDSLITAQAEKIKQLKLHKKGLMQGLFPKMSEL